MKKATVILLLLFYLSSNMLFAQVGINNDNSGPDGSAMLDVKSSSKGFLPPRMTQAELNAITNPADGLMVYCTDCGDQSTGSPAMFINGSWYIFHLSCLPPVSPFQGSHVPFDDQIVWNWSAVPWATGYKWNTSDDYSSATDLGNITSKTETGLTCNTPYVRYVWTYNSCGNSAPVTLSQSTLECQSWSCGQPITDNRDSKVYNTVQIGTQCWFQQNLNIGTRINGSQDQADNGIIEKYCYNNDEANCATFGGLYQWDELMQYVTTEGAKGICPTGWHLPTDLEWTALTDFLGGVSVAGGKMKEAGYAHWNSPNTGATNSSGFTAFAAGYRSDNGGFGSLATNAQFWSSSQLIETGAYGRGLYYESVLVSHYGDYYKIYGFSCRCLKD